MSNRYVSLCEHITDIIPVDMQLSPSEMAAVRELLSKLSQLNALTKFTQSEERQMYEVRIAFDEAINLFEALEEHCSEYSEIICDPTFESAVCKI